MSENGIDYQEVMKTMVNDRAFMQGLTQTFATVMADAKKGTTQKWSRWSDPQGSLPTPRPRQPPCPLPVPAQRMRRFRRPSHHRLARTPRRRPATTPPARVPRPDPAAPPCLPPRPSSSRPRAPARPWVPRSPARPRQGRPSCRGPTHDRY